jgi:hypothetical protein
MHDIERDRTRSKTSNQSTPGRGHNRRKGFQQMRDAFQWQILGDERLRGVDVKVALAISLRLNRDDYEQDGKLHAWPGIDTIAEMISVPRRSIRRSLGRLVMLEHLRLIRGGHRPGDPHHYIPQVQPPKRRSQVTVMGVTGAPLISDETLTKRLGEEERIERNFDDFETMPGRYAKRKETLQ